MSRTRVTFKNGVTAELPCAIDVTTDANGFINKVSWNTGVGKERLFFIDAREILMIVALTDSVTP